MVPVRAAVAPDQAEGGHVTGQQHEEWPSVFAARAETTAPTAGPTAGSSEVAALRRELQRLRWEVDSLRERVQHLDGELGFAMLNAGRLRGRLDREVAAREALEELLARGDVARLAVVALPAQSPSRSRSAACRSGTRSFLTEVDT